MPGCSVWSPKSCGCSCGSCALLHYVPIPKSGSEATKWILWEHPEVGSLRLSSGSVTVTPGSPCANRTFCYVPGTHGVNLNLQPIPASQPLVLAPAWWRCSQRDDPILLRIATIRNPYERFVSSVAYEELVAHFGLTVVYRARVHPNGSLVNTTRTRALQLLRNDSLMLRLVQADAWHFVPSTPFVVGPRWEARAHILLRYAHLGADLSVALQTLRHRSPFEVHHGTPLNLVPAFQRRINDPVRGEHADYIRQLGREAMALIEKWYHADFETFGFVQLSLGEGARQPSSGSQRMAWVGQACTPITASATDTSGSFDVHNWPAPLACRSREQE